MIPVTLYEGRDVAVFGLGGSGLATALALKAGGANPIVWDDGEAGRLAAVGHNLALQEPSRLDWQAIAALVLSPGVPLTHPEPHSVVKLARASHVEVIGDIELFCRQRRACASASPFVAITGTNGKSTTTALIAHIFASAGHDVQLGGNIGTAVLSLEPPSAERVHVLECSSYQIDLAPGINPSVAVLLNLSEDHLDRHGTMAHYAAVKARLVRNAQTAVISIDDGWCAGIADEVERKGVKVIRISVEKRLEDGFYAKNGTLYSSRAGQARAIASISGVGSLRGRHNAQNACAALATAWASGLNPDNIQKGLASFPGLEHRMQQVGWYGPVLFINDTKATNADAAGKALASFDDIYWIAGGKPKTGGIAPLAGYFPKIRKAYLIGEAADEFAHTLEGHVPFIHAGRLDRAVQMAAEDARASGLKAPVVLLSPACASFDQFRNFEERGRAFCDYVRSLEGVQEACA